MLVVLNDSLGLFVLGFVSAAPAGGGGGVQQPGHGWVSSCSVEFCSASGWDHWLRGTGGTVRVPSLPAA